MTETGGDAGASASAAEHGILNVLVEKGGAAKYWIGIYDLAGAGPAQQFAVLQDQLALVHNE